MTSCCPRRRMRWSGATGAIARCKNRSTGYVRKLRSAHAWRWTCGEKPKGQGATKPSTPYMRHVLPKATRYPCYSLLEAVRKLMSNKSTSWKSLKAWQETDYPISPFLALPCLWHKILPYKGFVSRQPLTISRSCICQKTFLSPCAADFRRDSIVSPPSRVHPAVRCIESFVLACAAPLVHPKDFHHFVTEVVDDFDGDAS